MQIRLTDFPDFVCYTPVAFVVLCIILKILPIKEWAANKRAWKLLQGLLTPEQIIEAKLRKRVTETGRFGTYCISFTPEMICYNPILESQPLRRMRYSGSICLLQTLKHGPWYDVVATVILEIRSGNEQLLFKRGNFYFDDIHRRWFDEYN